MNKLEQILVATDFSSCSDAALERAADLARSFQAVIDVVHVWEAPPYTAAELMMVGPLGGASQTLAQLVESEAAEQLRQFVERARQRGIAVRDARLQFGSPARTIVDLAREGDYDLIAMGTHGRTGLSHFLLGSIAEKVVRHADRAVLTVREVAPARQPEAA